MMYSESEITNDFDQLSLLSGDTPKEKIAGYALSLSPKVKDNSFEQSPAQNKGRSRTYPTYVKTTNSNKSSIKLKSNKDSPVTVLGKGRGRIICPQMHLESESHLVLEKEIRLAVPQGYGNEQIELHFAHHLKETLPHAAQPPQPTALVMSDVPIPSNNVALSSLSRNAKKSGKICSNSICLEINAKNFPALK